MTPRDDHHRSAAPPPDAGDDVDAVAAARREHLRAMPDAYLICRAGGHRMGLDSIVRAERIRIDGVDHLQVTLHCACCASERVDVFVERYAEDEPGWLEPRHELVSREYRYAEHYTSVGNGRIPRAVVRAEWFRRHRYE
ncbi:hypothetical protein AB0F93_03495 [Micromonospora tulbaghiae]|uniref:hypothetical protein n=1 Tax=Micromonospora tulbaghiae TaxID=479978 RepID=UPI00331E62A5